MTIYDDARTDVASLLAEFGGTATLTRVSRSYSAGTRAATETTEAFTVNAVLLSPTSEFAERRDGIKVRERYAILGAGTEPAVNDRFSLAGITYPVTGVTAIAPDGTAVAYRIGLGAA